MAKQLKNYLRTDTVSTRKKYFMILVLLIVALLTGGATTQPTGKLTVVTIQEDWWGNVSGIGPDVPIYVYNSEVLVSRGYTDDLSSYTFELPYDTYTIYVLFDLRTSYFTGNDCYTPPYVLNEPQELVTVRCTKKVYVHFPFIYP